MIPPSIGMAVRFANSNGEVSATPAMATMLGAIGDIFRLIPATNCIGNNIITGAMPILAAMSGTRFAKEKKAALPEPINIAEIMMIKTMTMVINTGLKPAVSAELTMTLIAPIAFKPWANV